MSTFDKHTPLGELVDAHPLASSVLIQHGLDFCCGGNNSLFDACQNANINVDLVIEELEAIPKSEPTRPWSSASNDELIRHILDVYHAPLPDLLSHIQQLSLRVIEVHGAKDPDRLTRLNSVVHALSNELLSHMMKEEQILFPWILSNRQPGPSAPIQVMLMEHEAAGILLEQIISLTDNFQPPPDACTTWNNFYATLKHVDEELRKHIHLENNILFPRAA